MCFKGYLSGGWRESEQATEREGAGALPIARATPAINGFLYPCLHFVTLLKWLGFNFFSPFLHLGERVGEGSRRANSVAMAIPSCTSAWLIWSKIKVLGSF